MEPRCRRMGNFYLYEWFPCVTLADSNGEAHVSRFYRVGMFNATTCWNLDGRCLSWKWAIPTNFACEKFVLELYDLCNSVNWSAFAAWWKKSNDVGMLREDEDMRVFVLTFMVDDSLAKIDWDTPFISFIQSTQRQVLASFRTFPRGKSPRVLYSMTCRSLFCVRA